MAKWHAPTTPAQQRAMVEGHQRPTEPGCPVAGLQGKVLAAPVMTMASTNNAYEKPAQALSLSSLSFHLLHNYHSATILLTGISSPQ